MTQKSAGAGPPARGVARHPLALAGGIVGALAVVEFASGVLQGYYTPVFSDIARRFDIHDADINWLEAAQLLVSAIVVPVLAKLGDMLGHRRVLLGTIAVAVVATWAIAFAPIFPLFLIAWALQGVYVVWLPLNVAIIFSRARSLPNPAGATRRAAGSIVVALQIGAIAGALTAGQLGTRLDDLTVVLAIPALVVTAALLAVWRLVPNTDERVGGRLDTRGAVLLSLALLALTGGLGLVRLGGITVWVVAMVLAGLALGWAFVRAELRTHNPLIDIRLVAKPTLWPVFLTAGLFGVSVLGAQGPLSTFMRTDPAIYGYGLGLSASSASYIIGAYVVALLLGAGAFARLSALFTPRLVLVGAAGLVALGYLGLVPLHGSVAQVLACMMVAGLGSGALVAALPAAAAAAAPPTQTAMATGLTNTTKTIGGSFASSAFALALASGVVIAADGGGATAGSLSGYVTVWLFCGVTALVALAALLLVPKVAFTSVPVETAAG